jgi:hypothetical protein
VAIDVCSCASTWTGDAAGLPDALGETHWPSSLPRSGGQRPSWVMYPTGRAAGAGPWEATPQHETSFSEALRGALDSGSDQYKVVCRSAPGNTQPVVVSGGHPRRRLRLQQRDLQRHRPRLAGGTDRSTVLRRRRPGHPGPLQLRPDGQRPARQSRLRAGRLRLRDPARGLCASALASRVGRGGHRHAVEDDALPAPPDPGDVPVPGSAMLVERQHLSRAVELPAAELDRERAGVPRSAGDVGPTEGRRLRGPSFHASSPR